MKKAIIIFFLVSTASPFAASAKESSKQWDNVIVKILSYKNRTSNSVLTDLHVPTEQWRYLSRNHKPRDSLVAIVTSENRERIAKIISEEAKKINLNPVYAHIITMIESAYGNAPLGMCLTVGHPLEKKESTIARLKALYDPTCPKQPMGVMQVTPMTSINIGKKTGVPAKGKTIIEEKLAMYPVGENKEEKLRYGISRGVLKIKHDLKNRNGNFMQMLVDYNAGPAVTDSYIYGVPTQYKKGKVTNRDKLKTGGLPLHWPETITYIWKAYYYGEFIEKYPWLFGLKRAPKNWSQKDIVFKADYHGGGNIRYKALKPAVNKGNSIQVAKVVNPGQLAFYLTLKNKAFRKNKSGKLRFVKLATQTTEVAKN